MAQHKMEVYGPLLNDDGTLVDKGYAVRSVKTYDRLKIAASAYRIKEWDYYLINNERYALALTIADNGYMGLDSISWIDLQTKEQQTVSKMDWFPRGGKNLPPDADSGRVEVKGKSHTLCFDVTPLERRLTGRMKNFFGRGKDIAFDITLDNTLQDSMVIATPFAENPKAFYYNRKTNCMSAKGTVHVGGEVVTFEPETSMGVLDWGRGVWTYDNTWYWSSASGRHEGVPFGFNLGYGFGDTSAASENMLFYDGKAHKLDQVVFNIPQKDGKDDFLSTWTFKDNEGRLDLTFEPILDRAADMDFWVLASIQHQVFGRFSGKAVLDDGTELHIKDLIGFAEKVRNKW